MPDLNDAYQGGIKLIMSNYKVLKNIDPDNKLLPLISFEENGDISIKPKFWNKYGPIIGYPCSELHALSKANMQINRAIIQIKREKGLTSKLD